MKNSLSILTVPAFDDNYLWLIHNGKHAYAVDPGDATPILDALATHNLSLCGILLTHHHADHIGGVAALLAHAKEKNSAAHLPVNLPVYGPTKDVIPSVTEKLGQSDQIYLEELDLYLDIIDVPGHTLGHIAYYASHQKWLFCGDTLFAGGCGRLFEGTPAQMLASLDKLAALPEDTLIYCAHEYTISNLRFALAVDGDNIALRQRMMDDSEKREQSIPTVPSRISMEKRTNPFMRSRDGAIAKHLVEAGKLGSEHDALHVFTALREWKNSFR